MKINWLALAEVAGVTFAGTVTLVVLMAVAARLLATSYEAEGSSSTTTASVERIAGVGILVVMGLLVLYGIYLLVPYFR
jgi:ABC-type nickel/cobalt efflux system permease component RcnA